MSTDQKLKLYGFFKQAKEGPCTSTKPGIFDITGKAKWDAWKKLGAMSSLEAMGQYVKLVTNLSPDWGVGGMKSPVLDGGGGRGGAGGGGGGRPVVSTLMGKVEAISDEDKTIFDWCSEGCVDRLSALLTEDNINSLDDQGMSLLHWACDRGHLEAVKLLVSSGASVNQQDSDLQTPLHYAASCGHVEVVEFLASVSSIDKNMCDCDGATPTEVTSDPKIRKLLE